MNLSPEAERRITGSTQMAHLATAVDDRPHVAPVWYVYDDGRLQFTTGGRKLANLRANPRVAVSIEESHDGNARWTVTMLGTASVVEDSDRERAILRSLFECYLGPAEEWDDYYRDQLTGGAEGTVVEVTVASAAYDSYE